MTINASSGESASVGTWGGSFFLALRGGVEALRTKGSFCCCFPFTFFLVVGFVLDTAFPFPLVTAAAATGLGGLISSSLAGGEERSEERGESSPELMISREKNATLGRFSACSNAPRQRCVRFRTILRNVVVVAARRRLRRWELGVG